MPRGRPAAPERHRTPPRPHGCATPAPHSSIRCYRRKNGPQRQTQLGVSKGTLPRTTCSVHGKGGDPRGSPGREGFPTFSEAFPSHFFSCPLVEVSIVSWEDFFPGMEHYHPPPGTFFPHPRVLWLSRRASDSAPTGQLSLIHT